MKYITGFVFVLFLGLASTAQQKDAAADSVSRLISGYMKKGNWNDVYELSDSTFRKAISKTVFIQSFVSLQQTAFGNFRDIRFARKEKETYVYKIYFDEYSGKMILHLNAADKVDGFAIRPYNEPGLDQTIQTSNSLTNPFDHKLDSLVRDYIKTNYAVGISIAVFKNNQPFYYGYGETQKGNQLIPTKQSLFEIGSISKTFTAWLLAQQVLKGTISLDSSINYYLPDSVAAMQYKGKAITVTHLSNHTSGIPSLPLNFKTVPGYTDQNPYAGYTQNMLFSYLKTYKPFAEPGKKFQYSNMAVGILGNILELKTGKPYEQLVRQNIAEPLKMNYTALSEKKYISLGKLNTSCYNGAGDTAHRWTFQAMKAAGCLYTNAEDLVLYAKAILQPGTSDLYKALEICFKPTFTVNAQQKIGLGWFILNQNAEEYLMHSGGTGGYRSVLLINRKKQTAVIVLSNVANDVTNLGLQIMQQISHE